MKPLPTFIALCLMAGCSTAPVSSIMPPMPTLGSAESSPTARSMVSKSEIQPASKMLHLIWGRNYVEPDEQTVIYSSTSLSTPMEQWTRRWSGTTNVAAFPMGERQEFFVAENEVTN